MALTGSKSVPDSRCYTSLLPQVCAGIAACAAVAWHVVGSLGLVASYVDNQRPAWGLPLRIHEGIRRERHGHAVLCVLYEDGPGRIDTDPRRRPQPDLDLGVATKPPFLATLSPPRDTSAAANERLYRASARGVPLPVRDGSGLAGGEGGQAAQANPRARSGMVYRTARSAQRATRTQPVHMGAYGGA